MKTHTLLALICVSWLTMSTQAQSPREQLNQLVAQLQTTPSDDALREKIIKLAQALKPLPALPQEANRRMARGMVAFKEAKSEADFKDAVTEFQQATLAAPWYADAYYNLGIAQNKANDFAAAARSLKLYLVAAPDAPDAKAAQDLLYEMEFRQEKANKEKAAQAAQQAEQEANALKKAQYQKNLEVYRGTWYGQHCFVGKMSIESLNRGCNENDYHGQNWRTFNTLDSGQPSALHFEVNDDGTVKMDGFSSWARCNGDVFGVPYSEPMYKAIRWEVRPKDGPAREIYSRTQSDGSFVEISCDRPLSGADSNVAYHYVQWTRTR
jgi:tetratricopeptide (TPR) repeat protein